jgi:hypothetical protein
MKRISIRWQDLNTLLVSSLVATMRLIAFDEGRVENAYSKR